MVSMSKRFLLTRLLLKPQYFSSKCIPYVRIVKAQCEQMTYDYTHHSDLTRTFAHHNEMVGHDSRLLYKRVINHKRA